MEHFDIVKFFIGMALTTYSVFFAIVAKKVINVPQLVSQKLEEHSKILNDRFNHLDESSRLAHERLNVHDRISSKMSGRDFDSRAIVESGIYPELRKSPT